MSSKAAGGIGINKMEMENLGGSCLRSRRLERWFDTRYEPNKKEAPKCSVDEQISKQENGDDIYVDDNGWCSVLISCFRIITCFLTMMVTTFFWALIMLLLLPWPYHRIRQGNIYGHLTGRLLVNSSLVLFFCYFIKGCSKDRFVFLPCLIRSLIRPLGVHWVNIRGWQGQRTQYCQLWLVMYRRQFNDFKTRLLGKSFHTLIRNASFPSITNVESHNPPP